MDLFETSAKQVNMYSIEQGCIYGSSDKKICKQMDMQRHILFSNIGLRGKLQLLVHKGSAARCLQSNIVYTFIVLVYLGL